VRSAVGKGPLYATTDRVLKSYIYGLGGRKELCVSLIHSLMALHPFFGPGRFFTFVILHTVGRTPWTGDQTVARPLPTHRTAKIQNIQNNASSGIRTHDPSVGAGEDCSCFRPRGHRDRRYVSHGRAYLWRPTDEYPLEVSCRYQIKFPSTILLTWSLSIWTTSGYLFWRETESHSMINTEYTSYITIKFVSVLEEKK
jgi:hypothetical protein